jgi:hypothetical protein
VDVLLVAIDVGLLPGMEAAYFAKIPLPLFLLRVGGTGGVSPEKNKLIKGIRNEIQFNEHHF